MGWSCQSNQAVQWCLQGAEWSRRHWLPQLVQGAADAYPAAGLQWGSSTMGTMPRKCCSSMAALPAAVLVLRPAPAGLPSSAAVSAASCVLKHSNPGMIVGGSVSSRDAILRRDHGGCVGHAFGPHDKPGAQRSSTSALLTPKAPAPGDNIFHVNLQKSLSVLSSTLNKTSPCGGTDSSPASCPEEAAEACCSVTRATGGLPRSARVSYAQIVVEMPPRRGSATRMPGRCSGRHASHCAAEYACWRRMLAG